MKKFLMFLLLSIFTGSIYAEDIVTVDPVVATPNSEVELIINLENETVYAGIQLDITLPEGISFVETVEDGETFVDWTANASRFANTRQKSWTFMEERISDKHLRILAFCPNILEIKGNDGWLFNILIKADANAFPGIHWANVSNVIFSKAVGETMDRVNFPDALGEIVIPTTDNGYFTYASSAPYTIPSAVTAYTAKLNAAGTYVNITPVSGNMPAGEGILFQGTANFDFNFEPYTGTELAATDNQLIGGSTAMVPDQTNYDYYIFGDDGTHGVGFYHYTGTSDIPANKAVLRLEKTASASAPALLRIVQATTGVENVVATGDGQAYDVLGRKIAVPEHGLYIINGKVVLK